MAIENLKWPLPIISISAVSECGPAGIERAVEKPK